MNLVTYKTFLEATLGIGSGLLIVLILAGLVGVVFNFFSRKG
ncbi:hypothetical protein N9948_01190 [bacterium]|nr:hypothetical protein [bacterium]